MAIKVFFLLLTITCLISSYSSSARVSLSLTGPDQGPGSGGTALDCFTGLYKIRSCSNEIVAYFANGEVDITQPCCEAITLITHHCWPTVLTTLGYGPDQIYILRGYCDVVAPDGGVFGPVQSPLGPVPSPFGQPLPAVN